MSIYQFAVVKQERVRNLSNQIKFIVFLLAHSIVIFTGTRGGWSRAVPQFNGSSAFDYLKKQCEFGPRNPGSIGHRECSKYLAAELSKYAATVKTQKFYHRFGRPAVSAQMTNIIASFYPEKPKKVILAAHWDTRPWADMDPDPNQHKLPILGANDGASGVAVLLEIGRILKAHRPQYGVDIVFFDAEDCGIEGDDLSWAVGSQYFARHLEPGYQPLWGILVDMVGDRNLQLYQEINSLNLARPVVEKVWRKAAELGYHQFIAQPGYQIVDDHLPLLQVGIPMIDIIDFDYPFWHTMADTPDKCSPESLEAVGQVIIHLLFE